MGFRGFDAAYSFGDYAGKLRDLIHVFKYGRVRTLAGPLGHLLCRALPMDQRFDAVVPVPLHWRRRWSRGFNQSELLAQAVAKRYAVPVVHALARSKATPAQAGLSNAERRTNVSGAFRPLRRGAIAGRRILVIDDVMTTGATLSACASTLKRAGATHVSALTLARTDRRLAAKFFSAAGNTTVGVA